MIKGLTDSEFCEIAWTMHKILSRRRERPKKGEKTMNKNNPEIPFDTGRSIMLEDMQHHRFYSCPNCKRFYEEKHDCIMQNQVCEYCGQLLESRKVKI